MPEAYQIILLFVAVFGASFGFACLIKFGGNYVKEKMSGAGRKNSSIENRIFQFCREFIEKA